jgi:hypothetical protein
VTCRKIRYPDKIAALMALVRTHGKRRARRPKDEQRVYRGPVR